MFSLSMAGEVEYFEKTGGLAGCPLLVGPAGSDKRYYRLQSGIGP